MRNETVNTCSFCNSKALSGYSLCSKCMKLYNISVSQNELDGCGCDK